MKTLYLQKRGCNFATNDTIKNFSDMENYRCFLKFIDKKGVEVCGDVGSMPLYRFDSKSGKPLKKYIKSDLVGLHCDFQHFSDNGDCLRYSVNISNDVKRCDFSYTKKDILKLINILSSDSYDKIEFIEEA